MTDSHQGDTYNIKNTFYKYESDDRQVLVDLLHEYSEKLIIISQELEIKKQQESKRVQFYKSFDDLSPVVIGLTVPIILIIFTLFMPTLLEFLRTSPNRSGLDAIFTNLGTFLLLLLVVLLLSFTLSSMIMTTKKSSTIESLERNARGISNKLEKVMQVTIEIQDRIEINLARKLELDFRIGDAQSALEYYYSVVETKSNKSRNSSV